MLYVTTYLHLIDFPDAEYYVISNPVDVFGPSAAAKKPIRRDPLQAKAVSTKKVTSFLQQI